ncbi:hypothetical protein D3C75_489920 [compost metagenome]
MVTKKAKNEPPKILRNFLLRNTDLLIVSRFRRLLIRLIVKSSAYDATNDTTVPLAPINMLGRDIIATMQNFRR